MTVNLQSTHIKLRNFSHPGQRDGEPKGEKNKANFSEPPGRSCISRGRGGRDFQGSQTIHPRTSRPLSLAVGSQQKCSSWGEKEGVGLDRGHQVMCGHAPSSVRIRNS